MESDPPQDIQVAARTLVEALYPISQADILLLPAAQKRELVPIHREQYGVPHDLRLPVVHTLRAKLAKLPSPSVEFPLRQLTQIQDPPWDISVTRFRRVWFNLRRLNREQKLAAIRAYFPGSLLVDTTEWIYDEALISALKVLCASSQSQIFIPDQPLSSQEMLNLGRNNWYGLSPRQTLSRIAAASRRFWVLPLHVNGEHWTVGILDHGAQTLYWKDSLASTQPIYQPAFDLQLKDWISYSLGYSIHHFKVISITPEFRQTDKSSCGLWVLETVRLFFTSVCRNDLETCVADYSFFLNDSYYHYAPLAGLKRDYGDGDIGRLCSRMRSTWLSLLRNLFYHRSNKPLHNQYANNSVARDHQEVSITVERIAQLATHNEQNGIRLRSLNVSSRFPASSRTPLQRGQPSGTFQSPILLSSGSSSLVSSMASLNVTPQGTYEAGTDPDGPPVVVRCPRYTGTLGSPTTHPAFTGWDDKGAQKRKDRKKKKDVDIEE
ncbi:hypothetical protein QBC43DRAFT_339673 [Cladorrhinum sp. PSN259]|nr:hypothetical protein QBC43DRAFT_339673 [Cladorrhinum sp. PSN259]